MQRLKRRWWTWAVSLIATLVIAGAVLSGLFQMAVLALPSYREDLSTWVSDVAGRPVQIGGISLAWNGLSPRFDLSGITLYSDDGAAQLRVDRLSLGVSLLRLVQGHWLPTRLELDGLRISAEVDEQGRIRIAGFQPGDRQDALPQRREQWMRDLDRFERVSLQNCELRVLHPALDGVPLALRVDAAQLDKTDGGFELDADMRLPLERGGKLSLHAEIDGEVAQLQSWRGRFEFSAASLKPQGWLRPWLLPGSQIVADRLDAQVFGELSGGSVQRARLELSSGQVVLARAGVLSSARSSSAVVDYLRDPHGWRLDVADLSFDDQLLLRGSLRAADFDIETAYDFDADRMRLTPLAPWFGVWRDAPDWLLTAGRGRGELEGVVVRVRRPADGSVPRYSLRARLRNVGLREDRTVGFSRVSGELTADQDGGSLQLDGVPLQLSLPSILDSALTLDALDADLSWARMPDGWRLRGDDLDWRMDSAAGSGQFELWLPDDPEVSPTLDLDSQFAVDDVTQGKPYMPKHWPDSLKRWLQRAIVSGRVPDARLQIHGPLRDFPFHKRPTGNWQLDIDVADGDLAFLPEWPQLGDLSAGLHFSGNSLRVDVDGGDLMGNVIQSGTARFDDLNDHRLKVEARSVGQLAGYYRLLRNSPLHDRLRGLLDHTEATGAAQLALKLDIPLEHDQQPSVWGRVSLRSANLKYGRIDPPLTQLTGAIEFTDHGVSAKTLQGRFAEVPLDLRIDPQEGTRGVVRGSFAFAPLPDPVGPSQFIPEFVRGSLSGKSMWSLELPISDTQSELILRSDLIGTAVTLPTPLGKPAQQAAPTEIRIGGADGGDVAVDFHYEDRLAGSLRIAEGGPASTQATADQIAGLHLRFGAQQAPGVEVGRKLVDGRVDRLDLRAWLAMLIAGHGGSGTLIDTAEIEAGQLVWDEQSTLPTRLRYQPLASGWRVDLSGEGVGGSVVWQDQAGARLTARLDHVALALRMPAGAEDEAAVPDEPIDPGSWPVVDVECQSLRVGEADLGRLDIKTTRAPGGLQLDRFALSEGIAKFDATGRWQRQQGISTAELKFDLDTRDIEALLKGFDYAPNISARQARFSGDLKWQPNPAGLRWAMASGGIDVRVDEGQISAVQPGASRVLGLVNFYALPRRLTLNFDDVVGKGLSFDSIKGHFSLADGVAHTDDMNMQAPSLRMDIRGDVGLAARDYDQRVTVYPDVSGGVTLGAVLLGGPAVGALVLLAQELLDKPLDQATQLSYRITGPWENPVVERLDGGAGGAQRSSKE